MAHQLSTWTTQFEAYATQGFNTPDGRALIVSWIGLPDVDLSTDKSYKEIWKLG